MIWCASNSTCTKSGSSSGGTMLIACCCILTVVIAIVQTGPSDSIIGKWKSVEETEFWYLILEFGHDGSHRMTMLMEASGKYSVVGNHIKHEGRRTGPFPETCEFRIEDQVLFLKTSEELKTHERSLETSEEETRLERVGPAKDPASPIIGKWRDTGKFKDGRGYEIV